MWIQKIKTLLGKFNTQNGRILIIVGAIICVGIFFRAYNFSQWLHFEIDQVYDFDIVEPAVSNGIENLPLLGPNVGGGMARLGPAFYYIEYLGAKVFGNTPNGHAMSVLILSILSLPLFYVFCKRYFSTYESIGLLAIFSSSLYLVMYSRFSWSPNILPFLVLLSFYSLLRSFSKKEKHPARWFLVSVATVTVTSQIHFNSLFVVPLIAVLFTIIKRPRFNWKIWLAAIGIIFLIYSPVILNDIKTHGENLGYLTKKFKKTSPGNAFKFNAIIQTAEYNAYEYFFINTGNDQVNMITKLKDKGFSCAPCRENLSVKIFALIIFLSALILIIINFFKEKDSERKNFLLLVILWFLVSFYLVYSIADGYKMYPRFFLLMAPLAILFYGFILRTLSPEKNKMGLLIFVILITVIVFFNIQKINTVFLQLRNDPQTITDKIETEDIFPDTNRITLENQQNIADYIQSKFQTSGYPVYLNIVSEYAPSFWYLLEKRGIHYFDDFDKNHLYLEGNYLAITYSHDLAFGNSNFEEKESTVFGKLRVQYLQPVQTVGIKRPDSEIKVRYDLAVMSELLTWKKLFMK